MVGEGAKLDEVLTRILHAVCTVMSCEAASVLLLDSRKRNLIFQAAIGQKGAKIKGITLPRNIGIAGAVLENGSAIICEDPTEDPRFCEALDNTIGFITRSIIYVPLIIDNERVGVLEGVNKISKKTFSDNDLQVFISFADISAAAVHNAKANELLIRKNKALQRKLDEYLKTSSKNSKITH